MLHNGKGINSKQKSWPADLIGEVQASYSGFQWNLAGELRAVTERGPNSRFLISASSCFTIWFG